MWSWQRVWNENPKYTSKKSELSGKVIHIQTVFSKDRWKKQNQRFHYQMPNM